MTIDEQLDAWIDAHFDEQVRFLQEQIGRAHPTTIQRTGPWGLPVACRGCSIAIA